MKKIINVLILSVITVISVSCNNKMKDPTSKEYMTAVVESDEGKAAIEETLKNLDKDALTEKGIIKSYEIDYNSIEHNPMGGINFTLIINENKNLYIKGTFTKFNTTLEVGSSANSSELTDLLKRGRNE